jgi:hypothetical protein
MTGGRVCVGAEATAGGNVVWCRIDRAARPAFDLLEVDAL